MQIPSFTSFIMANEGLVDFYFINDGSTDDTGKFIKKHLIKFPNSFLINLERNFGKGNAIREAYLNTRHKEYSYYGFIDADLQIPLKQILRLRAKLKEESYTLAISTRRFSGATLKNIRTIGSKLMLFLGNSVIKFEPKLGDTQCGCKLMTKEVAEISYKEPFISNWLFDLEIFLRYRGSEPLAREYIVEVPVEGLGSSENSKFTLWQNRGILNQLLAIRAHYR